MKHELPDQAATDHEKFIDQVSAAFCRRGLRLPALIALEAGQPLAFLGGQLLWLAAPVLSLVVADATIHQTAQFLEDPTAVAALIQRLEAEIP
ncbi:MAG: hypothetical protein KC441_03975 [Anaerolineales bacterium]|nr:hypothetical protein [Anaerolineales bacterium]MCB8987689.1 hypothetical protein [Ardenticatenaceae bacterium]